jgi:hypothetical protein
MAKISIMPVFPPNGKRKHLDWDFQGAGDFFRGAAWPGLKPLVNIGFLPNIATFFIVSHRAAEAQRTMEENEETDGGNEGFFHSSVQSLCLCASV